MAVDVPKMPTDFHVKGQVAPSLAPPLAAKTGAQMGEMQSTGVRALGMWRGVAGRSMENRNTNFTHWRTDAFKIQKE